MGYSRKIVHTPHRGTWNSRLFCQFFMLGNPEFFSVFNPIPLCLIFLFFSEFQTNLVETLFLCALFPYYFWEFQLICVGMLFLYALFLLFSLEFRVIFSPEILFLNALFPYKFLEFQKCYAILFGNPEKD